MNRPTALLIIDMQRDFCEPGGYADTAGLDSARLRRPIAAIAALAGRARLVGIPVIYTREGHAPDLSDCPPTKLRRSVKCGAAIGLAGPLGRHLVRGEAGHGIIPELAAKPGETVIDKPGYGAFYRTRLSETLNAGGIRHLYLTGITTDICVQSTLREAVDRGYECMTVSDACAAGTDALHEAALAMIEGPEGPILGQVKTTEEVLARWPLAHAEADS